MEFKELRNDYVEELDDKLIYHVDGWKTMNDNEGGVTVAKVVIENNGHLMIEFEREEYRQDKRIGEFVSNTIQEALNNLKGKEIEVPFTEDTDLCGWLEEYKNPLIISNAEVESWGIWIEDCEYRIDITEVIFKL